MKKNIAFCPSCGTPVVDGVAFGKARQVCPACSYIHFVDPKVAACAFIEEAGKVLLVQRGTDPERGKWALPAGYVDYGEDPAQAAIREVYEETGLVIEINRVFDVMFYQGLNQVIVIIYLAQAIGGTLQAADDAEDAVWFTPETLPPLAFESTQRVLEIWRTQGYL